VEGPDSVSVLFRVLLSLSLRIESSTAFCSSMSKYCVWSFNFL
jgi:hypothetical protein